MIRIRVAAVLLFLSVAASTFGAEVLNPTFDGSPGGWQPWSPLYDTIGWQKIDATRSPASGSITVTRTQTFIDVTGAMQCVNVTPGRYDAGAKIMIPGQQGRARAFFMGIFFAGPNCTGAFSGGFQTPEVTAPSNGTFTPVARRGVLIPAGMQSVLLVLGVGPLDPNASATAHFDDIVFRPAGGCVPDSQIMCLNNGRFAVRATFSNPAGGTEEARIVQLTPDTAYMWFFSENNVEVTLKAINACAVNGRQWVFASGLTNVAVNITVTDMQTGAVRTYSNAQGTAFQPILDTDAFACP
jgi:hypothetical protein